MFGHFVNLAFKELRHLFLSNNDLESKTKFLVLQKEALFGHSVNLPNTLKYFGEVNLFTVAIFEKCKINVCLLHKKIPALCFILPYLSHKLYTGID